VRRLRRLVYRLGFRPDPRRGTLQAILYSPSLELHAFGRAIVDAFDEGLRAPRDD